MLAMNIFDNRKTGEIMLEGDRVIGFEQKRSAELVE